MKKFSRTETEDADQIAKILERYDPGFLPLQLFEGIARLVVTPTVELVIVEKDHCNVLLTLRPEDDHFWPGQLHLPGSVVLATDNSMTDTVARTLNVELGLDPAEISKLFLHFAFSLLVKHERGVEVSTLFVIYADESFANFKFYDPTNLPSSTIDHHKKLINILVQENKWL